MKQKILGVHELDEGLSILEYEPMQKNWWQSKTIWAGLVQVLLGMVDWTMGLFDAGQAPGWILTTSGLGQIALRLLTSTGISTGSPPTRTWLWLSAIALISPLLPAQTAPPPVNYPVRFEAGWDCVTTDVQGNPETIAFYELAFAPPTVNIATSPQLAQVRKIPVAEATASDGTCRYVFSDMVKDISRGDFLLYCRAYDAAGNVSEWSNSVPFSIDKLPPGQLKGLKVKVVIEVETGG